MNKNFEETHLCVRKYLLSMFAGEERLLPVSRCKYTTIKGTCGQLKKMGVGEWSVSKKGDIGDSYTRITRIK